MCLRSLKTARTQLLGTRQLPVRRVEGASSSVTNDGLKSIGRRARQAVHQAYSSAEQGGFPVVWNSLISVFLILSSLLLAAPALADGGVANLYQSPQVASEEVFAADGGTEQGVARRSVVTLNTSFLREWQADAVVSAPQSIGLPLFDGQHLIAELRSSRFITGRRVWQGKVTGQRDSLVSLILREGRISGSIVSEEGQYRLRYRDGQQWLLEIDQSRLPSEYPPIEVPLQEGESAAPSQPSAADSAADGSPQIDVLVLYTSAARAAEGGETGIRDLIDLAVFETNSIYANSGINQRLRLVYAEETSYVESSFSTDVQRLRDTSEGYMDGVHALRDTYGADMVVLIREPGEYCGIGYLQKPIRADFASFAFSVTSRTCATGYFTFGHELGHNMGAHHDRHVESPGAGAHVHSHGYINLADRWRTVMAYPNQCSESGISCPKAPYFSNPDVTHLGAAVGIPDMADNRRTLNTSAATVAAFRDQVISNSGEMQIASLTDWNIDGQAANLPGLARVYSISNVGGSALEYRIEASSIWLSLNGNDGILQGQLLPGQSTNIIARLNSEAANLAVGQHGAFIQFQDVTNASIESANVYVSVQSSATLSFPAADIVRHTDNDGDGYFSSFTLYLDADVSSGSMRVRPDVYARRNGGAWSLFHRGDAYTVVGSQQHDWHAIPFTLQFGFDTGEYDIRVDLFAEGGSTVLASRDHTIDDDFENVPLERSSLDSGPQDDNYEDNDTRATAYSLEGREGVWLNAIAGGGKQYDADWYRLRMPSQWNYVELTVDLSEDVDEHVELHLYDEGGRLIASSTNGEDSEHIVHATLSGEVHYIRVDGLDRGANYNLRWSAAQQEDKYEENDRLEDAYPLDDYNGVPLDDILGPAWLLDEDWYRIRLDGSDNHLTVDVFDAFSMVVTLHDSAGNQLLRAQPQDDRVHFEANYPAGYYYVRIVGDYSGYGYYGLEWSAVSLDDNYEPNNSRSAAFDLRNYEDEWLRTADGYGIQRDTDWYRIEVDNDQLEVGADVRLTHADGDINIRLRDVNGALIAGSATNTDREYFKYVVNQGGTYYLEVYGANRGNQYDLLWWDSVATPQHLLQVNMSGNGLGSVNSSPAGISCGSDCEERYTEDTVVNLVATAVNGSLFERWEGDCTGSGSCQVNMSRARSVTAVFAVAAAQIEVTPAVGFSASGSEGGPFTPSSKTYIVHNTGNVTTTIDVDDTASWASVSPGSVTLSPGREANVTVSINGNAEQLAVGDYSESLRFTDRSSGQVVATRSLDLQIEALTDTLLLTPGDGLSATGPQGGPFVSAMKVYRLYNAGSVAVEYQASISYQSGSGWLNLSPSFGSVAAGETRSLNVMLNSEVNTLTPGQYAAELRVRNITHGSAEERRQISLEVTGNQPAQIVFPEQSSMTTTPGGEFNVAVQYETSDNNNQLNGLATSIHFDSRALEWVGFVSGSVLSNGLISQDQQPLRDVDDLDGDPDTDYYLQSAWAALSGGWPNQALPTDLFQARFRMNPNLSAGDSTTLRFSSNNHASGYRFVGRPASVVAGSGFTLDIDGNGRAEALTDGLLTLRYLFRFRGQTLINGAVANDATRRSAADIEAYLASGLDQLDIDGNGRAEALTDGLLTLRYLFRFRGQTLINGAVANDATRRSAAEIEAYLGQLMP